jgi:site-specific DNA recombinase
MAYRKKVKELARARLGQQEIPVQLIALPYCRVSSKDQIDNGTGLHTQEHRGRQYAEQHGWPVEKVFYDVKTAKGDFLSRPGVVKLLSYVRNNRSKRYVVIFDDLKRFSRDSEYYWPFRRALDKYGVILKCPNFPIEDTPEGKWSQTVQVANGQLEREQNARQTAQKMRARVEQGFSVCRAPFGYKYVKTKDRGRVLVKDEPHASIIREFLEGFASGRFANQVEAGRWLNAQPGFPKAVGVQRITDILTRVTYAGYIEMPEWGVSLRKAQHDALISFETHKKIQDRIAGKAKTYKNTDNNRRFPLRGHVECADCGSPLTSCLSKGRNGYHPYYLCHRRGCVSFGKSIRQDVIEDQFGEVVRQLQPSETFVNTSAAMFERLWKHRAGAQMVRAKGLEAELVRIKRDTDECVDKLVQTKVQAVVTALEVRIQKLEEEQALTVEKIANCGRPLRSFDDSLRTAVSFLANPYNLWVSPHYEDKKALLKLAFPERLPYARNEGFRTANPSLPFKLLADFSGQKKEMVPEVGVEPTRF